MIMSAQLIFFIGMYLYLLFKGFPKGIAYRGDLLTVKMILDFYTSESTFAGKYYNYAVYNEHEIVSEILKQNL